MRRSSQVLAPLLASAALGLLTDMRWIEPIWKLLLSNKGILPILWELYPGHELLLEAHRVDSALGPAPRSGWIQKPMHSREGANIVLATADGTISTPGPYTTGDRIEQRLGPRTTFADRDGTMRWPVLGLWMVDQECCGMGIREDAGPITGNLSSFVPHYFD